MKGSPPNIFTQKPLTAYHREQLSALGLSHARDPCFVLLIEFKNLSFLRVNTRGVKGMRATGKCAVRAHVGFIFPLFR